jgi:hypothetical integral membrane protein (TIGR02206 family)
MQPGWASYDIVLTITVLGSASICLLARLHPGRWTLWARWGLAAVLLGDAVTWLWSTISVYPFSWATSLPLPLCDLAALVASVALVTGWPVMVELTYFWGLAGTIQALITPDLSVPFPHVEFFEYVIAHVGIVMAAAFLVIGLAMAPRRHAPWRVLAITAAYTAFVGGVDALTGGNYMYLAHLPSATTLLSYLGPWPWYVLSAVGVAVVLVLALDAPWWLLRRHQARERQLSGHRPGARRAEQLL